MHMYVYGLNQCVAFLVAHITYTTAYGLIYMSVTGVQSGGPGGRRKDDALHTEDHYNEFLDFIQ